MGLKLSACCLGAYLPSLPRSFLICMTLAALPLVSTTPPHGEGGLENCGSLKLSACCLGVFFCLSSFLPSFTVHFCLSTLPAFFFPFALPASLPASLPNLPPSLPIYKGQSTQLWHHLIAHPSLIDGVMKSYGDHSVADPSAFLPPLRPASACAR